MNAKKRYFLLLSSILFLLFCYYSGRKLRRKINPGETRQSHSFLTREELISLEQKYNQHWDTPSTGQATVDLTRCRMETCFNFTKCQENQFKVFIYPHDENLVPSDSYSKILNTIKESPYYTTRAEEACLFVLSLDTLDRDVLSQDFIRNMQSRVESLPTWNKGENHIIFNLYSGTWPNYTEDLGFNIGKAMLAKASIANNNYRPGFDISLPLFHRSHPERGGEKGFLTTTHFPVTNQYFLAFKGKRYVHGIGSETRNSLYHLHNGREHAAVTTCKHGKNWREMQDDRCEADNAEYDKWDYLTLLSNSTFCLVPRGRRLGSFRFLETLQAGCIPVILSNGWQLPFGEVLDWTSATVSLDERQLLQVPEILHSLTQPQIFRLRQQTQIMWDIYLSSVRKIVLTTLEIIRQRIFPHRAATYHAWNSRPGVFLSEWNTNVALVDDVQESGKFTAVISTRADSPGLTSRSPIFSLLRSLGSTGLVLRFLVLWNSGSPPPPLPDWFRFSGLKRTTTDLTVITTVEVNMTSRVEAVARLTSSPRDHAILTLDDDVTLSAEEIRFAWSVFAGSNGDFSDRIVGFTARSHHRQSTEEGEYSGTERGSVAWRYSSKASSQYSIITLSAAFFTREYALAYQSQVPRRAARLVSQLTHCEDILFNMVVAQISCKPPVKVLSRRRFQESSQSYNERLDEFEEKQICLNSFSKELGRMYLITSQVRLDPVLFKDPVSNMRKKYRKIELLQ